MDYERALHSVWSVMSRIQPKPPYSAWKQEHETRSASLFPDPPFNLPETEPESWGEEPYECPICGCEEWESETNETGETTYQCAGCGFVEMPGEVCPECGSEEIEQAGSSLKNEKQLKCGSCGFVWTEETI
jgi:predicted RNA-binding Zn-ribbon protein involved in translation (DUF1610 family)